MGKYNYSQLLNMLRESVMQTKEEGEKYLAENAKKDGVIALPSGLQYKVIKEGTGKKPKATDRVKCHYEGFLIDGTVLIVVYSVESLLFFL